MTSIFVTFQTGAIQCVDFNIDGEWLIYWTGTLPEGRFTKGAIRLSDVKHILAPIVKTNV